MQIRRNLYISTIFIIVVLSASISTGSSLPVECPGKVVSDIRQEAQQFELSFIFYHVAWCHESVAARLVYEQLAQSYHEQGYFATVDCYHLACNCSKTHPFELGSGTPNKWPTLVIRYGRRILVQYNGEWSLEALYRFIGGLFVPVERVHTREEVQLLAMHRDAVVLGIFNNDTQPEYRKFVSAAIKWLETDPEFSFRFAAAFGTTAQIVLGKANDTNQSLPQILLITSKGIQISSEKWNVSSMIFRLQRHFVQSLSDLYSYNTPKSVPAQLHLAPVLIILANDYFYNYMANLTNSDKILYNCSHSCSQYQKGPYLEERYVRYILERKEKSLPFKCHAKEYISQWNLMYYYALNSYLNELICKLSSSCISRKIDPARTINLQCYYQHVECKNKIKNNSPTMKVKAAKYLKKFVDSHWLDFKHQQNRSLSLVIVDNAKHLDFLQIQGIPAVNISRVVTMVIADQMRESIFVSQDMFTYEILQQFIRNYYNNNLVAYASSSIFQKNSPALYNKIVIEKVNRERFHYRIEQTNLTNVVMLYSPQCVFSAIASQALIQLSTMLDDSSGIKIIRLNTFSDDLPWEFRIVRTPIIIVFPRGRTIDSRMFPIHLKMDVRNIFGFILAQMEPVDQLKALLSCCRRRKVHSLRMRKCLQYVKALTTQHISSYLKLWQIFENNRYIVTERLAELEEINLNLQMNFPFY